MDQRHLNHKDMVNYGSYYTPEWLVDMVYSFLEQKIPRLSDYYILDTSCGYGGFLRGEKSAGADIDETAIRTAKNLSPRHVCFRQNSLSHISRSQYQLDDNAKIIIVGNPPYNDTTSMIRNKIKQTRFERDEDVSSRDIGVSFLLSYNKLRADYVCVLHPLSYLIKKSNFESLGAFRKNYKLTDSAVISSGAFPGASKTTCFPIIIGFYERLLCGMDYNYIASYKFKTHEGKAFTLEQYDTITRYITKYPNHKKVGGDETVAHFYTMRDINALKRAATFTSKENRNTIRVTKFNFPYYCYVDVFKEYIPHIPYYFGNSDIMINNEIFSELKDVFVNKTIQKHPNLHSSVEVKKSRNDGATALDAYFRTLLGEHYVG
ncbi:MAG: SAM-dependent methyltransferase [Treponema sp.]|jgi:hypothetical protein|nr:SAM-dependent methyltransferase [Treponema sp.]